MIGQLEGNPLLIHENINFGPENQHTVHPIHFLCDCVFEEKIDELTALKVFEVLIEHQIDLNGKLEVGRDSPLIAASSLYCDDIAIRLIDLGADLNHHGTHNGTCLHWAAWTGASAVVKRLVQENIDLEDDKNEFRCSPLLWGVYGLKEAKGKNVRDQKGAIEALLANGANPNSVDGDGNTSSQILGNQFPEVSQLISSYS